MPRDYWDRWLTHSAEEKRKIDSFFLKEILSRGVSTILDVGSGQGRSIVSLARLGFRVTCIDYSVEAIRILREVSKESTTKHMNIVRADILSLPFRSGSFGAITSLNVMNFFLEDSQRKQVFEEMIRVLKPKGVVLVVVLSTEDHGTEIGESLGDGNYWLPEGICVHYYTLPEVRTMLQGLVIHRLKCFQSLDKSHDEPHTHSLIYALASNGL